MRTDGETRQVIPGTAQPVDKNVSFGVENKPLDVNLI